MTVNPTVVPLLVFEAAGCLMAVPASEVVHLSGADLAASNSDRRQTFDLSEYFGGVESDGPWLGWSRGARTAWLRVKRVVDVVPVALSTLTPMPMLLRGDRRTRAFLAAGVNGEDVFLLLDPARLGAHALKVTTLGGPSSVGRSSVGRSSVGRSPVGRDFSRADDE